MRFEHLHLLELAKVRDLTREQIWGNALNTAFDMSNALAQVEDHLAKEERLYELFNPDTEITHLVVGPCTREDLEETCAKLGIEPHFQKAQWDKAPLAAIGKWHQLKEPKDDHG